MSSSSLRSSPLAMRAASSFRPFAATRSFRTGRVMMASKETAEPSEARKQEIESEKQQQLKEQKEGKAEWKQALASESESVVKADRGELKADKGTIAELQKESAKAAETEKKGQQ
ncbi:Hypothetical predicted protein [Lecanosticta acicola]|uniref:Uncharacterized protein n=1 Tax=Lecanosticta acicola TaxID=111012 RepID=A0AAI9EBJ1_9PEZI|nr:Hypothetical predicted protein [Lecanosticta acicola]